MKKKDGNTIFIDLDWDQKKDHLTKWKFFANPKKEGGLCIGEISLALGNGCGEWFQRRDVPGGHCCFTSMVRIQMDGIAIKMSIPVPP